MSSDDWVTVLVTDGIKAPIIQGALEAAGIPSRPRGEAIGRIYGLTSGPLGEVEILVPPDQVKAAKEIIAHGEGKEAEAED